MNVRALASRLLPWVVVAAIGWFFYNSLMQNWENVKNIDLSFNTGVALGTAFFVLAVVGSGVLWGNMLSSLSGVKISVSDAIRIHCASWVLKYIPGQVGSYLNKLSWSTKKGIAKKTVSTSFIYENVLMVFAGALLSIPVIVLFRDIIGDQFTLLIPLLVLIPMAIVLYKPVFYRLLNVLFKLIKKKPFRDSDFLSTKDLLMYQAGYLLPRLCNGVGFVLIVGAIFPIDSSMYIGLGATYILASIIGLLAIFVPGGLGVREAIIVLFLSVYFPVEQAIIISLIARFYATLSDIGVAVIYLVLNKGKLRQL